MIAPSTPKIIALDPGLTTGIAMHVFDNQGLLHKDRPYLTCVATTEISVVGMLLIAKWDYVMLEYFSAVTISKYGLVTTRLCGWIEAMCWQHNLNLVKRVPQNRKAFQKQAEEYIHQERGHIIHEADALAHLLAWEHKLREAENGSISKEVDSIRE